jgi:hypothetical protein
MSGKYRMISELKLNDCLKTDGQNCCALLPGLRNDYQSHFFENIATREVWLGGIAHNPDGNWMAQIGRNQCDMWSGRLLGQKYVIHDRDPLFCQRFKTMLSSIGCQSKPIPPRSPECNGYMESFIKTFKSETEIFGFAAC